MNAQLDLSYIDSSDQACARLRFAAMQRARIAGSVTADDLHDVPIGNRDKRVIGVVLMRLEKAGRLKRAGYAPSKRAECHRRPVATWVLP